MLRLGKIQVGVLNLDGSLDHIAADVQQADSRIQKANKFSEIIDFCQAALKVLSVIRESQNINHATEICS